MIDIRSNIRRKILLIIVVPENLIEVIRFVGIATNEKI